MWEKTEQAIKVEKRSLWAFTFGLYATLISLPVFLLGAYLGDKLGKRRNYRPWGP